MNREIEENINHAINSVFNMNTLPYFAGFIAIYIVLYFAIYNGRTEAVMLFSKVIDIYLIGIAIAATIYYYFSLPKEDKDHLIGFLVKWSKEFFQNPYGTAESVILIVLFYGFIYLGRVPISDSTIPGTILFIRQKIWVFLATFIIVEFFKYYFKLDLLDIFIPNSIIDYLYGKSSKKDKDNEKKDKDKKVDEVGEEVFNISNNLYTYDDAKAICTSYGARLASYKEMEGAYNKGAEWCSYGWSDGQLAFFPTQKSTWTKLQQTKHHKNDCGRPGINGGYIANPQVRFGVNCYGKKPRASDADINRMKTMKNATYPKSSEDILLDQKTQFWKDNADKLLKINGFNNDKWSVY
jgi:hypothetical protein